MRNHLNKVVGFAVFLGLLLVSSVLRAAEEGHGAPGGHEGSGSQLLVLAFSAINFVLFALVLRKYALPAVRDSLRRRRDTIVQTLSEAKRAKEEAESLRREYEEKLAGLAAEQERLRAQALEAAEREKQRAVEEARRMAERIQSETRLIAQREVEEARRLLRQEVSEQAVRIATELIRTRLTTADQSRLIQDFVREVNNAGNASR
ncbi:MAG TPA: ATP synthase F0 subunit B [Candidatus Binatia bacterium]|jgi:F-type H+-transporting ATPase subunit b|nr:ATP synthase F0 subunit B [Candidatus Binatia bacterium]